MYSGPQHRMMVSSGVSPGSARASMSVLEIWGTGTVVSVSGFDSGSRIDPHRGHRPSWSIRSRQYSVGCCFSAISVPHLTDQPDPLPPTVRLRGSMPAPSGCGQSSPRVGSLHSTIVSDSMDISDSENPFREPGDLSGVGFSPALCHFPRLLVVITKTGANVRWTEIPSMFP